MAATMIWGASFVVTREAVQGVSPLVFVSLRFLVAALAVAVLTRPPAGRLRRIELRAGMLIGLAMLGGYTLQALAMHGGIDSGRAAFISALYVPIVPMLQMLLLRRASASRTWIGLVLAGTGLLLMARGSAGWGAGGASVPQGLVLLGAFCIAAEIMLVGRFAGLVDPRRLAIIECATLATLCGLGASLSGASLPVLRAPWMLAALGLGLASAGLQIAVNWAQPAVGPSRAALIYAMEPVWAAFFASLAGERMGWAALAGSALILASVLVSAEREAGPSAGADQPGP